MQLFHNLHIKRLQTVSRRCDEVQAAMNSGMDGAAIKFSDSDQTLQFSLNEKFHDIPRVYLLSTM